MKSLPFKFKFSFYLYLQYPFFVLLLYLLIFSYSILCIWRTIIHKKRFQKFLRNSKLFWIYNHFIISDIYKIRNTFILTWNKINTNNFWMKFLSGFTIFSFWIKFIPFLRGYKSTAFLLKLYSVFLSIWDFLFS